MSALLFFRMFRPAMSVEPYELFRRFREHLWLALGGHNIGIFYSNGTQARDNEFRLESDYVAGGKNIARTGER